MRNHIARVRRRAARVDEEHQIREVERIGPKVAVVVVVRRVAARGAEAAVERVGLGGGGRAGAGAGAARATSAGAAGAAPAGRGRGLRGRRAGLVRRRRLGRRLHVDGVHGRLDRRRRRLRRRRGRGARRGGLEPVEMGHPRRRPPQGAPKPPEPTRGEAPRDASSQETPDAKVPGLLRILLRLGRLQKSTCLRLDPDTAVPVPVADPDPGPRRSLRRRPA